MLRLDEGVGFLQKLQKLRVDGEVCFIPVHFATVTSPSGCPALRQPPLEIVKLGPYTLHDYCSRVRAAADTGILDLTGVPVKRLPAAALHSDTLHTLLLADSLIEVMSTLHFASAAAFTFLHTPRNRSCLPLSYPAPA